eukprot:360189-Chlamydomonas_euryale.AAC.6
MFFFRLRDAKDRLETTSLAFDARGVNTKPTKNGAMPVTLQGRDAHALVGWPWLGGSGDVAQGLRGSGDVAQGLRG